MSRQGRDDPGARQARTAEERERARLEREARRVGKEPPAQTSSPAPEAPQQPPPTPRPRAATPRTAPDRSTPPAARTGPRRLPSEPDRNIAARGERPLRRIQPDPPAPPAAPAGALDDETDRPIGIRRVRRSSLPRAVVTPPADVPRGPARARRVRARITGFVLVALLAVIVIGSLMLFQPFGSAEGAPVSLTIPAGSSARQIGDQLSKAGVVDSGFLFGLRAAISGKRGDLRSGRHTLRRNMSYSAAITALSKAPVVKQPKTVKITIPEGRARSEIVPLAQQEGLKGSYLDASRRFAGALSPFRYEAPKGTRSLEGFLFPATYELRVGAPARTLVDEQLAAFRDNFARVDLRRAHRKNLTAYDVLIIASMVEREAQLAPERPLVAAVIYNRLKAGMPLGIDATIRYATNNWSRPLRASELAIDSPYNTRKRTGLPPTPIGNPGIAAIRAAAKPANVGYLYYVVKPGTCGKHAFSTTDAGFQRDRARYDAARAQAGGKSPTTC
jgi:uncharacterized YceG family protein